MVDDGDEGGARYRALAEAVDAIVFVTDVTSRMRYANSALERETGFTVADFQFPQADNPFIHRDDAPRVAAFLGAFVASDLRQSEPVENRFLDRWGRPHRCVAVVSKVRYGGEAALQFVVTRLPALAPASAATPGDGEYRALIEAAGDAILRLDARGRILFANARAEALTGRDRVELGKSTLGAMLDGDAGEPLARRLAWDGDGPAPGACGVDDRLEARLRTGGGDARDVEIGMSSLARFGARGEWLVIVRDVTAERAAAAERARLEEQLRDAQKLETVGGLAAGIAHDFNNLLAAVTTNLGLARVELGRGGDPSSRLDEIHRAASRAAALCRQLLAYTGRAPVSVGPVDLHVLVDDLAQLIGAALLGRGVLRRIHGGGPATVTADAAQLQQLVMNLIVNAADALGEAGAGNGAGAGGGVTVETGQRDGLVYLRVTDAGCGMDEATRARMFDPYFTTKRFGRGLGLAGVLGIVRAHHGAIDVTSAPGRGTAVEVTLPAGDGAAVGVSGATAAGGRGATAVGGMAAGGPTGDGWRGDGLIVVADDEPAVRAAVSLVLADAGFRIVEAADGVAALAALAEHPAAIAVVLDVTMPKLGGVEALRRMRAAGNAIPAVLISGYQETAISARIRAAMQPVEFLSKPFEVAELLASLRHALAQRC